MEVAGPAGRRAKGGSSQEARWRVLVARGGDGQESVSGTQGLSLKAALVCHKDWPLVFELGTTSPCHLEQVT